MPTMYKADLYHIKTGSSEQLEELKKYILDLKESSSNVKLTNPGCWRSDILNLESFPWLLESIKSLTEKAHNEYIQQDSIYKEYVSLGGQISAWANVNEPGSRNILHSHNSTYSGTFYIQSTNTGALRFCNPARTLSNDLTDSPFTRDFFVAPAEGDLLLWPSWIPHEVEPNLSNQQRINIAFDVHLSNNV